MNGPDDETRPRAPGDGPLLSPRVAAPELYLRCVFSEAQQPLPDALATALTWVDKRARVTIGRGPDGPHDIVLPWDAWASRRHTSVGAFQFGEQRAALVEDLASANGTWLDGQPVTGSTVARVGQILRVGSTIFVIGEALRSDITTDKPSDGWHMRSGRMAEVWRRARLIAASDDPVLLLGEPGTGKTRLAKMIHEQSPRADGPFVVMNASALPLHLEEATLFGVVGGFIPNVKQKEGILTMARGGTLFLDELADMPLVAQAKLLDAFDPLQKSYLPVGATRRVATECRLVCATNRDVYALARRGELRHDLLSRLAVGELVVPPLRERREDILPMFLEAARRSGLAKEVTAISVETAEALLTATWTENVRGLESFVRRLAHGGRATPELVRQHADRAASGPAPEPETHASLPTPTAPPTSARAWFEVLDAHQWSVGAVAEALSLRRETVGRMLTKVFGPGGSTAAQKAYVTWRATGKLPPEPD